MDDVLTNSLYTLQKYLIHKKSRMRQIDLLIVQTL